VGSTVSDQSDPASREQLTNPLLAREEPFFSVIVPTYRRPGQLTTCLEGLARLDYPGDRFEVIVVDDGSATPPEAVVARFRGALNVRLLTQSHAGPAAARNTGAAQARGQFLAFTDDDCVPASSWLRALAARFVTAPERAIGGRTLNSLLDNPYSSTSQAILELVYAYYNADPAQAHFFASNNLALPTLQFHAIGAFNATFATSEDRDLCDRWLSHGYRMTFAPEALIYHAHPLTFRTFWRQHFNYGRGAFRFHQARGRRGSGPFRPELGFYLNLLRHPLRQGGGRRCLLLAAMLLVWQMANTAGFVWEAMNSYSATRSGHLGGTRKPPR
jgi:glycosyltransferase involved in cell wall biosynthesis